MGRWKYNGGIPLSRKFLLFFMAGFLGGVIFSNLIGKSYMEYAGILSEYYLNRYKYMEIVRDQLFFYLVRERLSPVLFLLLLSFTAFGKAAVYLFLAWQGFSFGTLLTISILKFGGKGILLCVAGMVPQYLFYVPAMVLMAWRICRGRPYEALKGWAGGTRQRGALVGNAAVYFLIFILLVAGIALETWVNPDIVQKLLNFL